MRRGRLGRLGQLVAVFPLLSPAAGHSAAIGRVSVGKRSEENKSYLVAVFSAPRQACKGILTHKDSEKGKILNVSLTQTGFELSPTQSTFF